MSVKSGAECGAADCTSLDSTQLAIAVRMQYLTCLSKSDAWPSFSTNSRCSTATCLSNSESPIVKRAVPGVAGCP